jgi:3-methyladenine DNA glycosylase AlkD
LADLNQIRRELRRLSSPARAKVSAWFFKTGPGQYGEGDRFIGITVPSLREFSRRCFTASLNVLSSLLDSPVHEERLLALMVLAGRYEKADAPEKKKLFSFYLKKLARVNNWDLVDLSAPGIFGAHLFSNPNKKLIERLVASKNLWERRVAVVGTFWNIRQGRCRETFRIAGKLLKDKEDLIHKAAGWMLRETGKRDKRALELFLKKRAHVMPRTMLRYAIERFPKTERRLYLNLKKNSQ